MSSSKFLSISEYKSCTKLFEIEEPLDFAIFRPLAYVVVKLTYFLPLTPNMFSFFAFLSALFAGWSLIHGESHFFYGGLGVFAFSVFDCCDGMLARLKKNGSFYGEMIDMLVDLISNICFFFGLAYGVSKSSNYVSSMPFLVIVSGIFILIHASIYRYYRTQYEFYLSGNPEGRHDHLEMFRAKLDEVNANNGSFFEKFILTAYLLFSDQQKKEKDIKVYPVEDYLNLNKPLLPLWGFIAGTSHLFVLSVALMFSRPEIYVVTAIVIYNLMLLWVWWKQTQVLKKLERKC